MSKTNHHFKKLGRMLSKIVDDDPRHIARYRRQLRDRSEFGAVIIGLDKGGRVVVCGCRPDNVRKKRHKYQLSDTLVRYVPDAEIARRLADATRRHLPANASADEALRELTGNAVRLGVSLDTKKPPPPPTLQDWFEAQRYTP